MCIINEIGEKGSMPIEASHHCSDSYVTQEQHSCCEAGIELCLQSRFLLRLRSECQLSSVLVLSKELLKHERIPYYILGIYLN